MKSIILAKYQASSGHLIELSIVRKMNLAKSWTKPTPIALQPRPRKCSNLWRSLLIYITKRKTTTTSSTLAKHQASSGHLIELSIVGKMNLAKSWTTPTPVALQPRPKKCSTFSRFFLIQNMKRMTTMKSSVFVKYEARSGHLI
jgi:hypothetical protein